MTEPEYNSTLNKENENSTSSWYSIRRTVVFNVLKSFVGRPQSSSRSPPWNKVYWTKRLRLSTLRAGSSTVVVLGFKQSFNMGGAPGERGSAGGTDSAAEGCLR